jgi:hypothetical protein
MELKSLMEKIMFMNDALGYSDNTERLINNEYLLKDDSEALKELEKLLVNSIKYSQSQELKLGLEIILVFISHKNEDVKNAALAKTFILMDDGLIQELVVKELKKMSNTKDKKVSESAEYSLGLIATEIHKLEIMDAIFDIFIRLKNTATIKISQFPVISSLYFNEGNSAGVMIKTKNNAFYSNLLNLLICKLRAFNRQMDKMFPYLEEIENYNESFIQHKKAGYLDIQSSRSSEKESVQKLADFYAGTFTERGHLRRLISLLDDDDYDIRQIGVNALIGVIETLLRVSTEKKSIKPLKSEDLEKISPFRS